MLPLHLDCHVVQNLLIVHSAVLMSPSAVLLAGSLVLSQQCVQESSASNIREIGELV